MTQLEALDILVEVAGNYLSTGYDDPETDEACEVVLNMANKMREKERRRKERDAWQKYRKSLEKAGKEAEKLKKSLNVED